MTNIIIPPAALERGTEVVRAWRRAGVKSENIARAAFLAMIEAWEGMQHDNYVIILPLTENPDAEA
jgi:hypothetical protein